MSDGNIDDKNFFWNFKKLIFSIFDTSDSYESLERVA